MMPTKTNRLVAGVAVASANPLRVQVVANRVGGVERRRAKDRVGTHGAAPDPGVSRNRELASDPNRGVLELKKQNRRTPLHRARGSPEVVATLRAEPNVAATLPRKRGKQSLLLSQ